MIAGSTPLLVRGWGRLAIQDRKLKYGYLKNGALSYTKIFHF
jgi:hypothetical protein